MIRKLQVCLAPYVHPCWVLTEQYDREHFNSCTLLTTTCMPHTRGLVHRRYQTLRKNNLLAKRVVRADGMAQP